MKRALRITNPHGGKVRLIPFANIHSVAEEGDGCEVLLLQHASRRDPSICKFQTEETIDDLERQFNAT